MRSRNCETLRTRCECFFPCRLLIDDSLGLSKTKGVTRERNPLKNLVGRAGFEPATNGLKVRCSTG